VGEKGGSR